MIIHRFGLKSMPFWAYAGNRPQLKRSLNGSLIGENLSEIGTYEAVGHKYSERLHGDCVVNHGSALTTRCGKKYMYETFVGNILQVMTYCEGVESCGSAEC